MVQNIGLLVRGVFTNVVIGILHASETQLIMEILIRQEKGRLFDGWL